MSIISAQGIANSQASFKAEKRGALTHKMTTNPHDQTTRKIAFRTEYNSLRGRQADSLAHLGFHGLELCLGTLQDLNSAAARITALPADTPPIIAISATLDEIEPEGAAPIIVATIKAAARVGATCLNLSLPPLGNASATNGFPAYQSAINFAHRLFDIARFEAERSGVALALEVASGRCFLSPVEMRELVDSTSNWAVGACLDVARAAATGEPADWIRTLTHRLHTVRITAGPGTDVSVNQQAAAALCEIGFARTVGVACEGGPAVALEHLQQAGLMP